MRKLSKVYVSTRRKQLWDNHPKVEFGSGTAPFYRRLYYIADLWKCLTNEELKNRNIDELIRNLISDIAAYGADEELDNLVPEIVD